MDASQKSKLISVYRRYGFTLARDLTKEEILVFTLKTGYFDNAEIVKFSLDSNAQSIFDEFTNAGFACTIRDAVSPEQAENELFEGFFSVESTRKRLLEEYNRFADKLVEPYGSTAEYAYIKAPYQIDGREGQLSAPEEVFNRMNEPEPILFLIEAAAGFGKTCTALEIVKLLATHEGNLPLYAELSRNRQARIFRYILLDEIDRSFPLLSSGLVQTEIKNGRVATILDGFDELLRKNEDTGEFENKEPMLETVSELLTGCAKIIITTRRTVLFDGDEFHQWLDRHAASFKVIRMRIQEPRVADWLVQDRLERLAECGLQIDAMANPVLLSYLRCIDDANFNEAVRNPELIVESYFVYMLEREKDRQDLRMNITAQNIVLESIAADMMNAGYTAESREHFVDFILNALPTAIDEARSQYAAAERPSREEIANKLASHALLDRSATDPNKMSFINEFALGHYVAANIVKKSWLSDDLRFIDPAVRAYAPRSLKSRNVLYESLSESIPFLDTSSQIEVTANLVESLPPTLENAEAEGLSLDKLNIGTSPISYFLFNECIFKGCHFYPGKLTDVTFLNCKFYDCTVQEEQHGGAVYILGGMANPDISTALGKIAVDEIDTDSVDMAREADLMVLRKLWPIGEGLDQRPSRPIYKPLKFLCTPVGGFTSGELYASIDRLTHQSILIEKNKSGLITLNYDHLPAVLDILRAGK